VQIGSLARGELGWLFATNTDLKVPCLTCSQYLPSLNILRSRSALTRFMGGLDMSYSLDFNIHEKLAEYLAGEISLREFEDWFFPETWDIDQIDNLALANLVNGIKLRLAEFSNGDWTEAELRSLLRPFFEKHVMVVSQPQPQYGTSSISYRVPTSVIYSGQSVDIKSLTVYV